MKKRVILAMAVVMGGLGMGWGGGGEAPVARAVIVQSGAMDAAGLKRAAGEAAGEDISKAKGAIAVLRAAGPAGLAALLEVNAATVKGAAWSAPESERLRAAADQVAMQKDGLASGLYWYTDMDAAKAEAARTQRPILSLVMLGKLDEDLSCANSRFFRTTLYANAEVSAFLREHYVLHWESERPVPVITIDMGDGRKIVRTITGNSIHYVLDYRGRVVDGIPGLYGAQAFLQQLKRSLATATAAGGVDDGGFMQMVKGYESQVLREESAAWKMDLAKVGVSAAEGTVPGGLTVNGPQRPATGGTATVGAAAVVMPTAVGAAPRAMGKGMVEMPILVQIMPDGKALEAATNEEAWKKIAALHQGEAVLDPGAVRLVKEKSTGGGAPDAAAAARLTFSKRVVEDPMMTMIRNLEGSIALDTVKNEYELHGRIHEWLAAGDRPAVLKDFNERVYADLFLTPRADPWLGLVPADTFSALDNGGVCKVEK